VPALEGQQPISQESFDVALEALVDAGAKEMLDPPVKHPDVVDNTGQGPEGSDSTSRVESAVKPQVHYR